MATVRIPVDTDVFIDYFNAGQFAATALDKRLPLMTRNWRHFRHVAGLTLYSGR